MAAACLRQQMGSSVCIKYSRSCTGCFRGNLPYFGRTFVRLRYLTSPDVNRYDNGARRAWQSCGSTYCTCIARYVIGTLRRVALEPQPGRSTPKDDFLLHQCVFFWFNRCLTVTDMLTHWGRGHLNCLNARSRGFFFNNFNPLNAELNPICYLLALLAHHFLHVSRIGVKSLTLGLLMSYIYIYIYIYMTSVA